MTLDHVTTHYLDVCHTSEVIRHAATELELPATYSASYGKHLLARPLFVAQHELDSFAADLLGIFDLLVSLPGRFFDSDLGRYCAAVGMDERLGALMRFGATGRPTLYGRADAYHDGTAFRLLEFNVGSELGGIDTAQLNRAYRGLDAFSSFAIEHDLAHVDTTVILADALRACGRAVAEDREPVVALLEGRGALADHAHVFTAIREAMRREGIELLLGELDHVSLVGGKVAVGGRPVDVVLRYFSTGQVLDDPTGYASLELLMKAHDAGRTALFTPLEGALFATKGSLALLHEPLIRAGFDPAERELVDRIVPWTRTLGGAMSDTDRAALVARCRAERESLIVKPGVGYGGVGAVLGREQTDAEWADTVAAATTEDHVMQRIVTPRTEPVLDPVSGAVQDWRANWGIFATRDGYAGAFVRALQAGDGSVISYSNPGTRGTCVFSYPSDASRRDPA